MFCKECGAEIMSGEDYCRQCGTNVIDPPIQSPSTPPIAKQSTFQQNYESYLAEHETLPMKVVITRWWFWAIISIILLLIILAVYASSVYDMTDKFNDYLKENNLQLPSGSTYVIIEAEQDHDKYYTVLNVSIDKDGSHEKWALLSADDQKKDMKALTDAYMDFAKQRGMDAYYYLYATHMDGDLNYVYNAEKDVLYYPETFAAYAGMYSRFDTLSASSLIGNQSGELFLIENGLATYKNRQTVPKPIFYYNVFISGGDLSSYGGNVLKD